MGSEVWYRKWRPQTFAEVAGQPHITRTLARAVQLNRVAHAYLFCGPRGTGKTSTARILAKAVNCEANEEGQPCGRCESCVAVKEGRALDLIEMDAASNRGIDEIRNLRDKVGYSPNAARFKVYLIDEVHELTQFAFDALLKTLEEPPPHVIFVLATTEAHRVPETILSRCQRFDFVRIKLADVLARLRQIGDVEHVEAEDEALELLARRATGSLRDAVNLFEQAVASQGRVLTADAVRAAGGLSSDGRSSLLVSAVLDRRLPEALEIVAAARDDGRDLRQLTREAVQHLRTLLLVRAGAEASLGLSDEALNELRRTAAEHEVRDLLRLAKTLASIDFRADPQSPLPLELAVVECVAEPPAAVTTVTVPAQMAGQRSTPPAPPAAAPPAQVARISQPKAVSTAERLRSLRAPLPSETSTRTGPAPVTSNGSGVGSVAPAEPPAAPAADTYPEGSTSPNRVRVDPPSDTTPYVDVPADSPKDTPGLSLYDAQRRFRELYERCRAIDRKTAAVLNSAGCDIVEIDHQRVVIGFQHERMVTLATNPAYEPSLRQAVKDVFGAGYEVGLMQVPNVPNRLQLLDSERPSHLLDEALKLGAKPVART